MADRDIKYTNGSKATKNNIILLYFFIFSFQKKRTKFICAFFIKLTSNEFKAKYYASQPFDFAAASASEEQDHWPSEVRV